MKFHDKTRHVYITHNDIDGHLRLTALSSNAPHQVKRGDHGQGEYFIA